MGEHMKPIHIAVFTLLLAGACDSSDPLVSPEPADAEPSRGARQASLRTPDDEYARVSRAEVPGFAGFYLQDDGTPVVRLVDPGQRGAAQRYLAQELVRARRGRHANAPQQPIFRSAAYDFAQLKEWADALTPMLKRGDVFLIDVDEVENRVMVGVQDASAIAAVRAEGSRLGIPAAALHVRTQARPEQRITLQQYHNPVYGGIQIAFNQLPCTMGFNATRFATGQPVFVTNSHCTPSGIGGAMYQPTVAPGYDIGNKVADVGLWDCGGTCRWSDAAYVGYTGARPFSRGIIARTSWAMGGPAPITEITPYNIVARYNGNPPVGTWLDKTGAATGSTYGQVTHSCVTLGNLVCQDMSKVWSEPGDSGAPMFIWLGGSDVQLQGILWGGPANDPTTSYSSPLVNIEYDLGPLTNLCALGYGC
jgi:hypothetical protein